MARLNVIDNVSEPQIEARAPLDVDEIFKQYSAYVARIALRVLGDPTEVEDIVQDVFLTAHKHLKDMREPKAIKGWLATITVRRVNKALRWKRFNRFIGLDTLPDRSALLKDVKNPQDSALLVEIYRALDRLPANVRSCWVLKCVEGESLDRVAELCGCSRATAHRRVIRAQKALQRVLHDERSE